MADVEMNGRRSLSRAEDVDDDIGGEGYMDMEAEADDDAIDTGGKDVDLEEEATRELVEALKKESGREGYDEEEKRALKEDTNDLFAIAEHIGAFVAEFDAEQNEYVERFRRGEDCLEGVRIMQR